MNASRISRTEDFRRQSVPAPQPRGNDYRSLLATSVNSEDGGMENKHTVRTSDTLFAVVKHCGRIIYTTKLGGMTSVEEVIKVLSRSIRSLTSGLVTVILRNGSQGWLMQQGLVVGRGNEGMQLSLF